MHISTRVFKSVFLAGLAFTFLFVLATLQNETIRDYSIKFSLTLDAVSRCLGNDSCSLLPIDIMTSRTTDITTAAMIPDSTCATPLAGVAYIKTHKTGSTTLGHIMNRFGYQRNMSFVLDKKRSNGHLVYTKITKDSPKNQFLKPLNVKIGDYKNYKYDMVTVHVRYYREAMDTFMKPDTRYITIIRDPGTQFESAFVHFQFDDALPGNKTNRTSLQTITAKMEEWFRHPDEYLEKLKTLSWDGAKGLRFFYARNNQIFDLGLDVDQHGNETTVDDYIEKLTKELDMVIITEYIEESLLVMKKQFCWSLEDILFIAKNERSELAKNYTITESLRDKMREWNAIDYKLYRRFNDTLWRKIDSYGEEFYEELKQYRRLLSETFHNCTLGSYFKGQGRMFQNINYKPATGTGQLCRLIAEHKRDLMKRVRTRQLPPKSPIKPKTKTSTTKISIPVDKVQLQQLLQSNNTLLWNQTDIAGMLQTVLKNQSMTIDN